MNNEPRPIIPKLDPYTWATSTLESTTFIAVANVGVNNLVVAVAIEVQKFILKAHLN